MKIRRFGVSVLLVVLTLLFSVQIPLRQAEATSGAGVILGSLLHADREYFDVDVDSNVAYVAEGDAGLELIDVSDEEALATLDTFDTDGEARGVAIEDDCAYVADMDEGIIALDISETDDVTEANTQSTEGDAEHVFIDDSGDTIFVAMGSDGIGIYEIDAGDCDFGDELTDALDVDGDAHDIFVDGDTAYVAADSAGLVTVDISDLENPEILDTFETGDDALAVFVDGDYAYVATNGDGLTVIDVSNPATLVEASTADSDGDARDVYVDGDIAYLAIDADGVQTFDVNDPTDASEEDADDLSLSSGEAAVAIFVDGNIVYVTVDQDGFYALDGDEIGGSGSSDGGFPDLDDGDFYVDSAADDSSPDGSRDDPFDSIQDAIDEADDGDRIIVMPGTYEEEIEIDLDDLELIGVGPTFVTIQGSDDTVTISSNGVTLQGFTITGGDKGVLLDEADDFSLLNNVIVDNDGHGIHVDQSNGEIINNTIFDNGDDGIAIDDCEDLTITNNIIASNGGNAIAIASGATTGIDLNYNLYFDHTTNLSGITAGTTDVTPADPDFEDDDDSDEFDWDSRGDWEDDFHLSSGSPAEDAGDPAISDPDDTDSDIGAFGGPEAEFDDGDEPDKPTLDSATISGSTITLEWDESDERDLYGYIVYQSTSSTGTFSALNDAPITASTYQDAAPTSGSVFYRIAAIDFFEDESDESNTAEATESDTDTDTTDTTDTEDYPDAAEFTDSGTFDEFIAFIDRLAGDGVISGFSDGSFRAYNNVTRAELLKMSIRGAGIDTTAYASTPSTFSDVSATHSLKAYINYAASNSIVSGQGGKFRPNDPVTRFEATKIILETFDIMRATAATSSFTDVTTSEMIGYVEKAKSLGIVSGIGTRFYPNNHLTRAEASKIISNTMDQP